MRPFLSVIVVLGCLAPLPAQANPYAAYVAKYFGKYLLGKALDEAWDAATDVPDVKELDMRLRAFEGALSQVDARLSNRIGELRRRIDQRPTRDQVRQIVLQVLGELEARIAELEQRADRIEQKIAQFEEVFGIITVVPPAPLIRASVEAGNPAVHPLTAEWARLLCESQTSRLKLHELRQTLQDDHPDVLAALKADEAILGRIAACHAKVLEESVKRIDERMDLLRVERLKATHPKVRLVDDNLASLLWLRAVSKPISDGPQKGRLSLPKDMTGPKCSEILAAFRLADADVTVLAPLFRQTFEVVQQLGKRTQRLRDVPAEGDGERDSGFALVGLLRGPLPIGSFGAGVIQLFAVQQTGFPVLAATPVPGKVDERTEQIVPETAATRGGIERRRRDAARLGGAVIVRHPFQIRLELASFAALGFVTVELFAKLPQGGEADAGIPPGTGPLRGFAVNPTRFNGPDSVPASRRDVVALAFTVEPISHNRAGVVRIGPAMLPHPDLQTDVHRLVVAIEKSPFPFVRVLEEAPGEHIPDIRDSAC